MERQVLRMTDSEFDVLDELYFVTSFGQLKEATQLETTRLIDIIQSIHQKGWIRIMETVDEEVPAGQLDLPNLAGNYYFLATKEGLLAHNS